MDGGGYWGSVCGDNARQVACLLNYRPEMWPLRPVHFSGGRSGDVGNDDVGLVVP